MAWINTKIRKCNISSPIYSAVLYISLILSSALLLNGCATSGGERQVVNNHARQSCTAANSGSGNSKEKGNENCLPLGVIEIHENYGVDPEIRNEFKQAVALLNEEKYEEAIKLLKAVCGQTSKFSAPYINLGIAYERINEYKEAEKSFKKALEINENHPVAKNELGLIYRKTGRYKEAREVYENLLAMYPDFLPARKNLGILCDIYLQDLNCALDEYNEYLKGIPDDKKVKIWVADVKSRM